MKTKGNIFTIIGILCISVLTFVVVNNHFSDSIIENSTDIEFLAASSTSQEDLELDYGLKEYSIHESENLVFYLNIKNKSAKNSNNVYIRLASWAKAMRIIYSDSQALKDSVTYKVDGKTADFTIDCLTSCDKINGNVTSTTASQSVGIKLGTIPAGKSATLEVKFKWVGEEKQDTMYGVWKKLSAEIHEKNSDYSETLLSNYKVFSYNVMKSVHRQEITIVDKDGNVINDLHDLEVKDNKVTAYLNIEYNYLTDPSKHFGTGITYFDENIEREIISAANEPEYYKSFNAKKLRIILPKDINYDGSSFKSDLLDLKTQTNNTNKTFDLEPKEDVYNIKTTVKIPLSISKDYLNKQICITPSYVKNSDPTTYILDESGLSGVNKYCVGPYLYINDSKITATKTGTYSDGKTAIDLKIAIKNKNIEYQENGSKEGTDQRYAEGNGRAEGAIVTYKLPSNVEVSVDELPDNAAYDKVKNEVSIKTDDIKYNHYGYVTIPLKVSSKLTSYTITRDTISVEGKTLDIDKDITIITNSTYVKGDWNQDGDVTQTDLMYARQYLAKVKELKLPPVEIYDFNDDNEASISDINGLRKLLVEMDI